MKAVVRPVRYLFLTTLYGHRDIFISGHFDEVVVRPVRYLL